MIDPQRPDYVLAQFYAERRRHIIVDVLGFGIDGRVYLSDFGLAIKVHERERSYRTERDVYVRLRDCGVQHVAGHAVPALLGYDDSLLIIEMSVVQPPYILDFAKAQLDFPPDFPAHVMEERYSHWADLFDDRWPHVLAIMRELERRFGVYLLDPHPGNIAFLDD